MNLQLAHDSRNYDGQMRAGMNYALEWQAAIRNLKTQSSAIDISGTYDSSSH
jgi:hypothetical protein